MARKPAVKGADTPETTNETKPNSKRTISMGDSIISLGGNLADFDDFELLPKGTYKARCTVAEIRTSDAGNEYIYQNWVIDPTSFPVDYPVENAPEGVQLNYSLLQVPNGSDRRSITRLKKFMRTLGMDINVAEIDPETWVGTEALVKVGHQKFRGEPSLNITGFEALDE